MSHRPRLLVLGSLAVLVAMSIGAPVASAKPPAPPPPPEKCDSRNNDTQKKLLECVTLAGVREHQAAFQAIADANGGVRTAGTPGYEASVQYVVDRMTAAGYNVTLNPFPFVYIAPATLTQLTPIAATYATGAFTGSGYGPVTGNVIPVDINLVLPRAPVTSGCEAADFAGLDFSGPADIALIQRGTCTFAVKVQNAEAAGAEAVIIFNQGNTPAREELIVGTLDPFQASIPVVGASFADGAALSQAGSTAAINVPQGVDIVLNNVIAESRHGNPDNVVVAGAHLDSVEAGPGINDNGSGVGAILEVAEQMAKVKTKNMVRFAWWGAEEAGLVGSDLYVAGLSQEERDKIALYLNFDMIGSPNYVFFIYDGDDSDVTGAGPGPDGSAAIEKTFEQYFTSVGEPFKGTDFSGRSDYGPFIAAGIPAGGLFTGAEGVKTAEEAAIWGGTAGQQYDACYHRACDTYANNNDHALDVNSDAVAYATLRYSMSTYDVNGEGKKPKGPMGPKATNLATQ